MTPPTPQAANGSLTMCQVRPDLFPTGRCSPFLNESFNILVAGREVGQTFTYTSECYAWYRRDATGGFTIFNEWGDYFERLWFVARGQQ